MRILRRSFLLPLLSLPILVVGYLALPVMMSPASASGTTLYVAIGGHDTGTCQAASSPCATIDYAASQASFISENVGDTISVGPGVFKANLQGTPEQTGHGYYGPLTIEGNSSTIEPGDLSQPIFGGEGSYVLSDLTIDGLGDTVVNISGLFNVQDSSVTITDSTITNSASVFSDTSGNNEAADAFITDSTLTGNATILDLTGPWDLVDITASTITGNGSGIENTSGHAGTTQCGGGITCVTVTSTLLSDNHDKDCAGELIDGGYNLADDTSCGSTNYSPTLDGSLGTLSLNGGPTDTIPLLAGSPAIGFVHSAALCSTPDQRGVPRPTPNCDSGAYQTTPADTDTVTNCSGSSSYYGSLPYEVANAASGDNIKFSVTCPSSSPITLTNTIGITTQDLSIQGHDANSVVVNGAGHTAFYVNGMTIAVSGLTVEDSKSAFYNDKNTGSLTVIGSTLSQDNDNTGNGGAINFLNGSVTVETSDITDNTASDAGGGIDIDRNARLNVLNSTISNNSGVVGGGGISDNQGTVTISDSTVSGNSGGTVGGVDNENGTLQVQNSTIAGNQGGMAGGLYNVGTTTVTNSTFAENSCLLG